MGYFGIIKTAVLVFPFLALALSLPIFIYQYRKNGSFVFWRGVIIYSFIFYMLTAYFLIILPLPSIETVRHLTTPRMNLEPLMFVQEFIKHTPLVLTDPHTYLKTLLSSSFLQPAFNILLTVPFGIYLRYYFHRPLKQVFVFGFCLSLFFELTQLSGLYGIYPRPYRLFDVDDLLLNTSGAVLGYGVAPLFAKLFPAPSELARLEQKSALKVSYLRRFTAWMVDMLIYSVLMSFVGLFNGNFVLGHYILVTLLFVALPLVTKGQTFGKMLVRIKIVGQTGQPATFWQIVGRQGQLYYLILPFMTFWTPYWLAFTGTVSDKNLEAAYIVALGSLFVCLVYLLSVVIALVFRTRLVYEKLSKTKEIAVIKE